MYVSSWIIVAVLVITFYYIVKRFKKTESHIVNPPKVEKISAVVDEELTDDQKQMVNHISAWRERSSKEMPIYEEMLKLSKQEFQTWLFFRVQKPNRHKLLTEMVRHEGKTGSFEKEKKERISELFKAVDHPPSIEFAQAIFKKDNRKMVQILHDENVYGDEIQGAIFANGKYPIL